MYAIVAGGGGIGAATAARLSMEGWRVTVIDKNPKVCERLIRQLPKAEVQCGEVTNPHVLEDAGVKDADAFIAATGEDDTNVMAAILAKTYGVRKIIVRIKDPTFMETCKMVGLSLIVNPAESTAIQIDSLLRGVSLVDVVGLARKDLETIQLVVGKDFKGENRFLEETELYKDKNLHPVLIIRDDEVELPKPDFKLKHNDRVLLLRKKGFFETLF